MPSGLSDTPFGAGMAPREGVGARHDICQPGPAASRARGAGGAGSRPGRLIFWALFSVFGLLLAAGSAAESPELQLPQRSWEEQRTVGRRLTQGAPVLYRTACWNVDHKFIESSTDVNFDGNGGFLDVGTSTLPSWNAWAGQWNPSGTSPLYVRPPIQQRARLPDFST